PRVCYALSPALISASNALPSNIGRSQMVHSLAYHFGLLGLPSALENQATSVANSEEHEEDASTLVRLLAGGNPGQSEGQDGHGSGKEHAAATSVADHLERAEVITPEPATEQELQAFHSGTYIEVLLSGKDQQRPMNDEGCGLVDDCHRFPELAGHVRLVAGASITAAKCLANDTADIAINWDGGRHHAHKSRAAGFCYVNDIVLAILELRKPRKIDIIRAHDKSKTNGNKRGLKPPALASRKRRTVLKRLERLLYLDLDLHWGDGVEEAFRGSSSVLTLSIHNRARGFYPVAPDVLTGRNDFEEGKDTSDARKDAHSLHLPLHPDAGPGSWARVWSSCVMPVLAAYEPEAIVVQCGLDGLAGDPMKQWNLDLNSVLLSVDHVLRYARQRPGIKVLLFGGGGYNSPNAARGWTAITALALGRLDLGSGHGHSSAPPDAESPGAHIRSTCSLEGKSNDVLLPPDVLTLQSAIPETSPDWPLYGAAATLDIPAGDRLDLLNDEEYLRKVEQ
ncbi:Arginase/deacetylase, partial [Microstroma glucosiphilum]